MDFGRVHSRKWFFGTGLFVAVLFALIRPEGSVSAPFAIRLLQWCLNVYGSLALLIFVHERLNHWTSLSQVRPWVALATSGLIGAFLFSPFALAIDLVFGENVGRGLSAYEWIVTWFDELAGVTGTVMLVWLGMNAPAVLGLDFDGSKTEKQSQSTPDAPVGLTRAAVSDAAIDRAVEPVHETPHRSSSENALLGLLPDQLGQDIAWMKSELHYLRVVTPMGKALVLFNLSDAARCMPEGRGMITHRSYWVAFRHIERYVTSNGQSELIMKDGTRIPVARRRRAEVRRRVGL